jgi:hypothetical protein
MANSKTESKPIRLEFFRILFLLIWYCFELRISTFELTVWSFTAFAFLREIFRDFGCGSTALDPSCAW